MKKIISALVGIVVMIVLVVGFFSINTEDVPVVEQAVQSEPEPETKPEPEPYVEPEVNIIMVGDVLLHENVQESGKLDDDTYNYDHLFANVKERVQQADIAMANQEVILGGAEIGLYGYPNFNGPYEVGDALVNAGFNVILHATNHTLDRGKTALVNCMNFWEKEYPEIAVLGVFDSQKDYDNPAYIYKKDGIKIAILNYTYGTNGMPLPSDMPYAVALLEKEKIKKDLKKANKKADFVVVCPHWGTEYHHEESQTQHEWAEFFMENGVDLVIGTHPHYIQPVEMLSDDKGNQMLVYYSLGNFINSTGESGRGTADRMIGAMADVTVAKKEDGTVYIKEYGVEPLVTQLSYEKQEITTYFLSDYTKVLASENKIIEKDSVFSLKFCKELCKEVFDKYYP